MKRIAALLTGLALVVSGAYGPIAAQAYQERAIPKIDGLIHLSDTTPTQSLGASLAAEQIYIGANIACAILSDDSMRCWGNDTYGGVGNGGDIVPGSTYITTPVTVAGGHAWATADVASGAVCAITTDGDLYCWGANDSGQIGNGSDGWENSVSAPVRVGTESDWIAVTGYSDTFCGLREGGSAWCWGANYYGSIGDGTTTLRNEPTRVIFADDTLSIGFSAIDAGMNLNCGVLGTGELYCWGYDDAGAIGASPTPSTPVLKASRVGTDLWANVGTGYTFACARHTDKTASCFGWNGFGQLGDGTTDSKSLTPIPGIHHWDDLSLGFAHTCGIDGGNLYCWGYNPYGQVDWVDPTLPILAPKATAVDATWSDVDNGDGNSCAITAGDVWCWGTNGAGILSDEDLSITNSARWVLDGSSLPSTNTQGSELPYRLLLFATLTAAAGLTLRRLTPRRSHQDH